MPFSEIVHCSLSLQFLPLMNKRTAIWESCGKPKQAQRAIKFHIKAASPKYATAIWLACVKRQVEWNNEGSNKGS